VRVIYEITMEIKNADDLLAQVETQVKSLNEAQASKIDLMVKKYTDEVKANGEASEETREKLKQTCDQMEEMREKTAELSEKLLDLQQKLTEGFNPGTTKSIGEQLTESESYKQFANKERNQMVIEVKNTILTESGSPLEPSSDLVQQDYRALNAAPFRQLNLLDIIPTGSTASNMIHIPKETSHTNAAAETSQGETMPESAIVYGSQELPVRDIDHFIEVAEQALADAPFIEGHINMRMNHGIRHRLQTQIISGNGTTPNLSGLTDTGNFTAFTPATGDTAMDSLNKAKYSIVGGDYQATHILMNPATFGSIERVKVGTSRNDYASGDGVALTYINGQPYIWGLPVVLNNDVTANKLLVIDNMNTGLWTRQGVEIEMTKSDGTNFQKKIVTIRGTGRFAFGVFRNAAVQYGDLTV